MKPRSILLSVTPKYVELIAGGAKTIELRRRFPDVPAGTRMYLYSTLPIGAVTTRVRVESVDFAAPPILWKRYSDKTGVSKKEFDSYFDGREIGCAVEVSKPEAISPTPLASLRHVLDNFVVPQSYRYLTADDEGQLLGRPRPT